MPVLETPKGCIFESNAIARYVARLSDVGLFGNDNEDMVSIPHLEIKLLAQPFFEDNGAGLQGRVEQWIDSISNDVDAPLMSWILPLMGIWSYDKKVRVEVLGSIQMMQFTITPLEQKFVVCRKKKLPLPP